MSNEKFKNPTKALTTAHDLKRLSQELILKAEELEDEYTEATPQVRQEFFYTRENMKKKKEFRSKLKPLPDAVITANRIGSLAQELILEANDLRTKYTEATPQNVTKFLFTRENIKNGIV